MKLRLCFFSLLPTYILTTPVIWPPGASLTHTNVQKYPLSRPSITFLEPSCHEVHQTVNEEECETLHVRECNTAQQRQECVTSYKRISKDCQDSYDCKSCGNSYANEYKDLCRTVHETLCTTITATKFVRSCKNCAPQPVHKPVEKCASVPRKMCLTVPSSRCSDKCTRSLQRCRVEPVQRCHSVPVYPSCDTTPVKKCRKVPRDIIKRVCN